MGCFITWCMYLTSATVDVIAMESYFQSSFIVQLFMGFPALFFHPYLFSGAGLYLLWLPNLFFDSIDLSWWLSSDCFVFCFVVFIIYWINIVIVECCIWIVIFLMPWIYGQFVKLSYVCLIFFICWCLNGSDHFGDHLRVQIWRVTD